jgi:quinohemoprotein amine dehydrogenase
MSRPLTAALLLPLAAATLFAQPPARRDTTSGFPVTEPLVMAYCSGCHARDSTGVMQRISFLRKSVEGWETSVRRMVALHGVKLDPTNARAIVRYLANQQGLAPAEAKPGLFESERRMTEFKYSAHAETERTCRVCHSMGRVILQRRTRDEWEHLSNTHRALYPVADFQGFRRGGPPPADSAGAPQPIDVVNGHLSRTYPLRTSEWTAWSATMRAPRLEGTWLLCGYEPGRGPVLGRVTIARSATAEDEFTTRASYRYAMGGRTATREGRAIVYTGFQWRGRSGAPGAGADAPWREVLHVEPGWQAMSGRWFTGAYDELGIDVTLTRVGGGPAIAGVTQRALQRGAGMDLAIVGANLPRVAANAVDFGPGIRVERLVRATPDSIVVRVVVDEKAAMGSRDLFVAGASLRDAVVVYDSIARIRVAPLAGMARTGGEKYPKQLQQFDAIAISNGIDGKPETADDIEVGRVNVAWSLDEYGVTYDDDDIKFVGGIDQNGLFTPAAEGPNDARSGRRNNIGDVWVVATYTPSKPGAVPMKARAHLVSTVPLYIRFDPWRGLP